MNRIIVFIAVLCYAQNITAAEFSISLSDAIRQDLLKVDFTANGGHLGKCLKAEFYSLTEDTVTVLVDAGTFLECSDGQHQNLILTRRSQLIFNGLQHISTKMYAMCVSPGRAAPKFESVYLMRQWAGNELTPKMAQLIDSLNIQDYTAQKALWCAVNKEHPSAIVGYNKEVVRAFRSLQARYLRLECDDNSFIAFEDKNDPSYRQVKAGATTALGINGNYFLANIADKKFEIALYDYEGTFIRTISYTTMGVGEKNLQLMGLVVPALKEGEGVYARLSVEGLVQREWLIEAI
jgi:hypothetical protein